MSSRRTAIAVAVAICAVIAAVVSLVLLRPSGKQRALDNAPGLDLSYPTATLIDDEKSNAVLGADAYRVRGNVTITGYRHVLFTALSD